MAQMPSMMISFLFILTPFHTIWIGPTIQPRQLSGGLVADLVNVLDSIQNCHSDTFS